MAPKALPRIQALDPYSPGLSIDEIRNAWGLNSVIKMASNENPLGASPIVQEALRNAAPMAFRYPRAGNPRLARALAGLHGIDEKRIALGNGSDEIIDLLVRMLARAGEHNVVCFDPCFSIYPIQAKIAGVEVRRQPLGEDFSFDMSGLLEKADANTRLVFITTPDNPSGYCPPLDETAALAAELGRICPDALLLVDEAYMDFAPDEKSRSMLAKGILPDNVAITRTFSKSWGLAGMRLGYAVLPKEIADCFWRARLPFSINILAEEAALAALGDEAFRSATLAAVAEGREKLALGLEKLGCQVWPSAANFLMFKLPAGNMGARECFEELLRLGIIIRRLASYGLPEHLRVSVGNAAENGAFLAAMAKILNQGMDC